MSDMPTKNDRCICQDQHRRGYCTEPGCPYARTKNGAGVPQRLAAEPLWKKQLRHEIGSRKPLKITLAERS